MFNSDRSGGSAFYIFKKSSSEPNDTEGAFFRRLDSYTSLPMDLSRDGHWVIYTKNDPERGETNQIGIAPTSGKRTAFPCSRSNFNEQGTAILTRHKLDRLRNE